MKKRDETEWKVVSDRIESSCQHHLLKDLLSSCEYVVFEYENITHFPLNNSRSNTGTRFRSVHEINMDGVRTARFKVFVQWLYHVRVNHVSRCDVSTR